MKHEPLYSPRGIYLGHHPTITVEEALVQTFLSMVVQGMYYEFFKSRIRDDSVFDIVRLNTLSVNGFLSGLHATHHVVGPYAIHEDVFHVRFMYDAKPANVTMWVFCFYQGIFYLVVASPPNYLEGATMPDGTIHP